VAQVVQVSEPLPRQAHREVILLVLVLFPPSLVESAPLLVPHLELLDQTDFNQYPNCFIFTVAPGVVLRVLQQVPPTAVPGDRVHMVAVVEAVVVHLLVVLQEPVVVVVMALLSLPAGNKNVRLRLFNC
jgi:hypothetical protein